MEIKKMIGWFILSVSASCAFALVVTQPLLLGFIIFLSIPLGAALLLFIGLKLAGFIE